MQELLLFQSNRHAFGIDLSQIKEVNRDDTPFTDTHPIDDSLTHNASDRELPLFDVSELFWNSPSDGVEKKKKIVVRAAKQFVGLMVDRIDGVIHAGESNIQPLPPVFNEASIRCFPHVLQHNGTLILLIDPKGILSIQGEVNQTLSQPLDLKTLGPKTVHPNDPGPIKGQPRRVDHKPDQSDLWDHFLLGLGIETETDGPEADPVDAKPVKSKFKSADENKRATAKIALDKAIDSAKPTENKIQALTNDYDFKILFGKPQAATIDSPHLDVMIIEHLLERQASHPLEARVRQVFENEVEAKKIKRILANTLEKALYRGVNKISESFRKSSVME
jgi:chemotaxis signal transduction protein